MNFSNFTECINVTDAGLYTNYNSTPTDVDYVIECLGVSGCMPTHECTRHIEQHVRPGVVEWVVIAVYTIMFFVGLIGNGLVCFVVFRTSHMRTIINIFIVNLAVADFLVLLICLPPSLLADTTESWYLGELMCKIVHFLQTVSVAVSVLTLGAIAIERYFAICHPLRRRLSAFTVTLFIVGIWIASILIALPELLFQKLYRTYAEHVTPYLQYCAQDLPSEDQKYYQIFLMVALYDFPMCLMFFAYTTISLRLWRDTFATPSSRGVDTGRRRNFSASRPENQLNARRKAAKMLMTIVIMFAICYLPVHVLNILRYNGTLHEWPDLAIIYYALVSRGLCYLNSAMNPIIYNFMSAKFRSEFKAAFGKCYTPFQESTKTPVTLYNFRVTRSNGPTRSERYSMNTLTTRQGWVNNQTNTNNSTTPSSTKRGPY